MTEKIIKQLKNVQIAQLPEYDEKTTELFISKINNDKKQDVKSSNQSIILGNNYLIKLAQYITNPPDNFTLHSNWNNGIKPEYSYMKIKIVKEMGKMIKISGFGYDYQNQKDIDYFWSGWVPKSSITILEENI